MVPSASLEPAPVLPTEVRHLEHLHLDALREVANIGAGHAATALSHMTGRSVGIDVPTVSVAARAALSDVVGYRSLPMVLVRLRATGPFAAGLVIAFDERDAQRLTDLLLDRCTSGTEWMDALGASAIKEVGNVLGGAYLSALASMTQWTIPLSPPDLVYARAEWAIELLAIDHPVSDYALCIETAFRVEGSPVTAKGHVLLFPLPGTIPALLSAVGLG